MCRLLGVAAPRPASVERVIGRRRARQFAALSRAHRDGWGTAWLSDEGIDVYRAHQEALVDPRMRVALASPARARIVHLRAASSGMPRAHHNTHPFERGGIVLAHNGYIAPARLVERLLGPEALAGLRGGTDSERYLALVWQKRRETHNLADAVLGAVRELSAHFPRTSLNALVMDEDTLVAVNAHTGAHAHLDAFWGEGYTPQTLPLDHLRHYYQMWMQRRESGTVAVSSTGIEHEGWEPLPDDTVTRIALQTMRVTTLPIFAPVTAR